MEILFLLLPLLALLLILLKVSEKDFYYADYAVLSLHFFSFIFLLLVLCIYILDKIFNVGFCENIADVWIMVWLVLVLMNFTDRVGSGQ